VFFVVNSNHGSLVWGQPFNQVELYIDGLTSDFSENATFFSLADFTLFG
jgi:hypothetical protein